MAQALSLKDTRLKAGMTQEKMAVFLNISRGQVAMAETGRRSLSVDVIRKLNSLEETLKYAGGLLIEERVDLINVNEKMMDEVRTDWDYKLKTAEYRKIQNEHRLIAMIREYDELLNAFNSYSLILSSMPSDAPEVYQVTTRYQFSEVQRKLNNCNEASQLKVKARIDLYESQAVVMKKFLE